MKTYMLIFILVLSAFSVKAISPEPYCYAASDFLVFKYQDYPPEIIAMYDDTKVYFDVNNDGVWEYQIKLNEYEKFNAITNWALTDGSYIHSDKPIIYNQMLFSPYDSDNYQSIPPISSLKNEVVLYPISFTSTWKIISLDSTINLIGPSGEVIIRDVDISTTIKVLDNPNNIWYVNSTKPIVAVAETSFSTGLGKDFIKVMEGNTLIAAIEDDTLVRYDKNGDGIFDDDEIIDREYKKLDLPAGTRIRSNKKIGVFESGWSVNADYSPALPTKAANDELYVTIRKAGKTFITGLFNDDEGFLNTTYSIHDEYNDLLQGVLSNDIQAAPASVVSNAARIKAEKPVGAYYHNYKTADYYRFQRPMQTIEPYITSFSRKKFLGINDTAIINVRVLNPTSYDLDNVKVTIRYTDDFKDPNIRYYISKKDLETDTSIVSTAEKTVTPLDYGSVKEFVINVAAIGSEEYISIDYYLTTPELIGNYIFPSASLEYDSEIWNYD